MIGRIEIQPHDIAHLLNKEWIGGKLETARTMGLHGKSLKTAGERWTLRSHWREPLPARSSGFRLLAYATEFALAVPPPCHFQWSADGLDVVHHTVLVATGSSPPASSRTRGLRLAKI